MKKALIIILAFILTLNCVVPVCAGTSEIEVEQSQNTNSSALDITARSAILMDYNTGTVLYEKNADEALPPASVTKIMTLLLVMEAIESGKIKLEDKVSTSEEAAAMGGSQVYLEPGEEMSVDDLLKCVIIASANDAAYSLAEYVSGSAEIFVSEMNSRAKALGMNNTNFENITGLDDSTTNHVTSARDIAVMSRALMKHEHIFKYTSIWMDTIRGGEFGLTNTNRLIRFYSGATGLKTGSTAKAKFCMSATAKRGDLHLIAVIMGAETRDVRNEEAKMLLDYGFATCELFRKESAEIGRCKILGGVSDYCTVEADGINLLVDKGKSSSITVTYSYPETLEAPIKDGDVVGQAVYTLDGKEIGKADIVCVGDVPRITLWSLFLRCVKIFFHSGRI